MLSLISKCAVLLFVAQVAANPCGSCDNCKAVPGNIQTASDAHCAPCANNGQSWWPCNQDSLCQCDGDAPQPSTTTEEPASGCTAVPGNAHAATDAQCAPCATGQSWWPCNVDGLCNCGGSQQEDPTTTTTTTTTECVTTQPEDPTEGCTAVPGNAQAATDAHCAPCATGQTWWPCNVDGLCNCGGSQPEDPTEENPQPEDPTEENPQPEDPTEENTLPEDPTEENTLPEDPTEENTLPEDPTEENTLPEDPTEENTLPEDPTEEPTQPEDPTEDPTTVIDSTKRHAQASVFGDYTTVGWNQVLCSQDNSDAKEYMANPICATAINMASATLGEVDQNGNPGFCVRNGVNGQPAMKASSCWKVTCIGADNALGVGVGCKHHNPIYLKTVDTNMESQWSLTADEFNAQCGPENAVNTPSCRAFDITVSAWNLMVVFAQNQGSLAGEPAGLNGAVQVEYEEVDCNDAVVHAAIHDPQCGLTSSSSSLLI